MGRCMSIRKQTTNRLTLHRVCHVCGTEFTTTADTPFMRQIVNVGGKKQKTCYFCSASCKQASYKHLFDGKAAQRKGEYDRTKDRRAYNHSYYTSNACRLKARARERYWADPEEYRQRNIYNKRKRQLMNGGVVNSG